jgi:hypothetical protein
MSSLIPDGVVNIFLGHYIKDQLAVSEPAIANVLRVCSVWRDLGLRHLWTDIILDNPSKILGFASNATANNLAMIRFFSITTEPCESLP